jgi:nucleolar protein 56
MRVREWYGWHFPELIKIVSENHKYARCALFIGNKKTLSDDSMHDLAKEVEDDEATARAIIDAARVSMGQDLTETDMDNVMTFAKRTVDLANYRKSLSNYLVNKMAIVAPNLAALIGETVGARLISHAGSLTNLAKYPASTVQILGAEKALFRALKTKGNTPKYGLIYHSSFIGKAGLKNKGRISRFLANKTSIASRIDNFSMQPSRKFGEALRKQVDERLRFYAEGVNPTKNEIAMRDAMDATLAEMDIDDPTRAGADADEEIAAPGVGEKGMEKALRDKAKKREKKRKEKVEADDVDVEMEDAEEAKAARKAEKKRLKAAAAAGEEVDEEALKKKLKKDKKEKRKAEGLVKGEVPEEQIKKKKVKA